MKISNTREFFNELYFLYIDLERESETLELMVGQGIFECEINTSTHTYHPLLLKRISLDFNSHDNILTISDTNTNPENYTMLLQQIDYINHGSVKILNEELSENYYHPLDRLDTPDYLKSFAHRLHSDSKYEENFKATANMVDKIVIYNNPVFFVRKRTGGVLKALEEIIMKIDNTGELSGPLLNLIGENVSQIVQPKEQFDLSQSLAVNSGEDKDILLSKEANKEQLEIAKRIENYNAVLVQGPPGTGKTHTIANLMGHFLAQGKNILVTSHTRKALSVVKQKVVPELQSLCVAVLDDNNKDMERSVDGITEYISSNTSSQLAENTEKLRYKRELILEELIDIRKELYTIKHKEYETIIFGGKGYSVAEAASFVHENQECLSYLPGHISLYKPLPVSIADLELLYQTNSLISISEEVELNCNLPNPKELLSPPEFSDLIEEKKYNIKALKDIKNKLDSFVTIDLNHFTASVKGEPLCGCFNTAKADELRLLLKSGGSKKFVEWQLNAISAGKRGGGFKVVWQSLIDSIKETYQFSSDIAPIIIGKTLDTSEKNISEVCLKILKEIKEYLDTGKKIKGFSLFIHKELISDIKINKQEILTSEDCNIIISIISLNLKRNTIKELWTELIEKHSGIAFSELGDEPEQSCISFVPLIEYCLNWYNETYINLKTLFLECGFCE